MPWFWMKEKSLWWPGKLLLLTYLQVCRIELRSDPRPWHNSAHLCSFFRSWLIFCCLHSSLRFQQTTCGSGVHQSSWMKAHLVTYLPAKTGSLGSQYVGNIWSATSDGVAAIVRQRTHVWFWLKTVYQRLFYTATASTSSSLDHMRLVIGNKTVIYVLFMGGTKLSGRIETIPIVSWLFSGSVVVGKNNLVISCIGI